jgi:uncharacterized membrane protein
MEKGRAEAFSDGVMVVAITLLELNRHVETTGHRSLMHQLGQTWPSFAAYVVSFFAMGVIWVNHHALFVLIDRVDRVLLSRTWCYSCLSQRSRSRQQRWPTSSARAPATHAGLPC